MNQQDKLRNYLIFATWLNLSKVSEQTGINKKTLSNFVNQIKCNPKYPDSKPRNLTKVDEEKLTKWLTEFTNFN